MCLICVSINLLVKLEKASRRGADKLINERRVIINGKVAKIGDQVNPGDDVRVNGEQLRIARDHVYIALK